MRMEDPSLIEEVLEEMDRQDTQNPKMKIRPVRVLAYTIASREAEPTCLGERCAWYVKNCECCAVKMFAMP